MMSHITRAARRTPLLTFYLLAFCISWAGYVPLLAQSRSIPGFASPFWIAAMLLPGIGPTLAALIVVALEQDWSSAIHSVLGAFLKPVPLRWLLVSILLPLAILLGARSIAEVLDHTSSSPISLNSFSLFAFTSLGGNLWEEVGWRGFALRRLETRHNALLSAILVGVLWALWHIPLFLLRNNPMSMAQIPFFTWAAGLLGQSILLACIFNSTAGSLQAVTLCHVSGNLLAALIGVPSRGADAALRVLTAALVLAVYGTQLRSPPPIITNTSKKQAGPI